MNINFIPSDIRKSIYPFIDYRGLLSGRAVCRKWREEIESMWPLFEKCSFAEFKESSRVIRNLKKDMFSVRKFEFDYSFDKANCMPVGNLMIRVITIWYKEKNRYSTWLETINVETQEKRSTDVVLMRETSPNLTEIHERGLMEVPHRSYYKDLPKLSRCHSEFFCMYRFNLLSVWNAKTLECVFSQPNLGKEIIFKAKNNLGYVTLLKNQIEIWDFLTKKLLFSQKMEREIMSCSDQTEDWIAVTFSHSQQVCFLNVANELPPLTIDYPIYSWHISNGTLLCISSQNRHLEIFCLKTGTSRFQSKTMCGLLFSDQFAQLKADSLEICDIASLKMVHQFPRPNITRIVKICSRKDSNLLCFLCERNPTGLELLFLDLATGKFFGDHVFKELHIERSQPRLGIFANCYTFLYLNDCKEHALFYDPKTGKLIKKIELHEDSYKFNDRIYDILDTKTFKEYRFGETKAISGQGNFIKGLLSLK
jgi:hypothetical protein